MREVDARALIVRLAAAFPRQVLEQPTVDLYVQTLKLFGSETAAKKAVETVISGARFFPAIAELREAYRLAYKAEAQERERLEREQLLKTVETQPRQLPSEAKNYLAGLKLPDVDEAERQAQFKALPSAGPGPCDDCKTEAERVRYGSFSLCARCTLSRLRAKLSLPLAPAAEEVSG